MAKSSQTIVFLVAALLSTTLSGAWLDEPENGWVFEYNAKAGFLPDEAADGAVKLKNAWYGKENNADSAWASMELVDGESVLHLANRGKNRGDEAWDWAHFRTDESFRNVSSGFLTIDFEFRVTSSSGKYMAFSVSAELPEMGNERKSYICWVAFSENKIRYLDGETPVEIEIAPQSKWHKARLCFDLGKGKYSLYLDGSEKALFEADAPVRNEKVFKIQFGDGSRGVNGDAELRYFKWTDRELVPVTKERR